MRDNKYCINKYSKFFLYLSSSLRSRYSINQARFARCTYTYSAKLGMNQVVIEEVVQEYVSTEYSTVLKSINYLQACLTV